MERRENDERTKRFQKKKEIVQRVMDNTEIEEHLDMLVGMAEGIEEEEKKQGIQPLLFYFMFKKRSANFQKSSLSSGDSSQYFMIAAFAFLSVIPILAQIFP